MIYLYWICGFSYFKALFKRNLKKTIELTDQELLSEIKSDKTEAFDTLYYRHFAQLARYAYKKLQNNDLTEEIVQDVFVELWKKRDTLETEGQIQALLYAILRNKILHELRARMIQNKHIEAYTRGRLNDEHTLNAESLDEDGAHKKMIGAIKRLSPQCQQAFTLSRYEHLSYKEIAARMNISVNTVEKHISKALMILRQELKEYQVPVVLLVGLLELSHRVR